MNTTNHINRRRFIAQASCAGISCAPFFSTLLNLSLTGRVAADSPSIGKDYRALVCIFLTGGIDSFNMLAPRSGTAYDEYKASRQFIAHACEDLLPVGTSQPNHPELGLHPQLPQLKALFDAGKLAFVSNVGALVRPITLQEYKNHIAVPNSVFAHDTQQEQWMTCIPKSNVEYGWGGRAADILRDQNMGAKVSMNISLSGNNLFQYGRKVVPYAITDMGSVALKSFDPHEKATPFETVAVNSMLEQQYKSLFKQTYVDAMRTALGADQVFSSIIEPISLKTVFPNTQVGRDLHMVARTIAGREAIGAKRQTFFVEKGGWDTHSNVVGIQKEHLPDIDNAVAAFMSAMEEIGASNQVTLFSASEFGRTLSYNPGGGGGGSDHAWGGNHFVVGGAVKGGAIYGQYPSLALNTNLDTGQGRLIPTMSVDAYSAELARWFGVSDTDLSTVFPNLGSFYSPSSGKPPVGFMS